MNQQQHDHRLTADYSQKPRGGGLKLILLAKSSP